MSDTMTPEDRVNRDGMRERHLQELGVEAEVRWLGPERRATVTIDVGDLDRLIGYRVDPSLAPNRGGPSRTIREIEARGVDRAIQAVRDLRWRHVSKATVIGSIEQQR